MGLKISLTALGTASGIGIAPGAALLALLLAGCGAGPTADGINDPFETANRRVHAFNTGVDRVLVGPASKGYGGVVPEPVKRVVGNVPIRWTCRGTSPTTSCSFGSTMPRRTRCGWPPT